MKDKIVTCIKCNKEDNRYVKQMCMSCYYKEYRLIKGHYPKRRTAGKCEVCNKNVDRLVGDSINKKVCKACYIQFKRTGSFERFRFVNKDKKYCIICKQERKIKCRHMCNACYIKERQKELNELYNTNDKRY